MTTREIGIVMHGVTGRMGTNQHLLRSILAIMRDGGVHAGDVTIMPRPVLAGRNAEKLRALAEEHRHPNTGEPFPWTTDVESAVRGPMCDILFDAASTMHRPRMAELAAANHRHFYCEKPTAVSVARSPIS